MQPIKCVTLEDYAQRITTLFDSTLTGLDADSKAWNESDHPRHPAGSAQGGEWRETGDVEDARRAVRLAQIQQIFALLQTIPGLGFQTTSAEQRHQVVRYLTELLRVLLAHGDARSVHVPRPPGFPPVVPVHERRQIEVIMTQIRRVMRTMEPPWDVADYQRMSRRIPAVVERLLPPPRPSP